MEILGCNGFSIKKKTVLLPLTRDFRPVIGINGKVGIRDQMLGGVDVLPRYFLTRTVLNGGILAVGDFVRGEAEK
jgi:hypothetical protein